MYNTVTCQDVIGRNKEEDKIIRNSDEVRYSVKNAKDKNMKKRNYYRLVNGKPVNGAISGYRNKEYMEESGFFLLDYDNKKGNGGWKRAWETTHLFFKKWGIVHFEKSANGGAHLTVIRTDGLTIEENIRLFELRIGLEFDHTCKDVSRACFLVPNEYVLHEDERYYADEKPQPLLLNEEEWRMIRLDKEKQEQEHRQQVEKRRESAPSLPAGEEEKKLRWLVNEICSQQVDLTRNYKDWINIGFIIANIMGQEGEPLYRRISSFYMGYDPRETSKIYQNLVKTTRRELTLGTLIWMAQQEGIIR